MEFGNLPESTYEVRITAERHNGDRVFLEVKAGQTTFYSAFLPYVAVSYTVIQCSFIHAA